MNAKNTKGQTPADIVVQRYSPYLTEVLNFLIEKKAKPNIGPKDLKKIKNSIKNEEKKYSELNKYILAQPNKIDQIVGFFSKNSVLNCHKD